MDHRCNILAQRDHTYVGACLIVDLCKLIDDISGQGHKDTLCLVGFYQGCCFFCGRSFAQDNGYAGDIAGYQRHTQFTDHCVGKMAIAGLFVGNRAVDVFQDLDELRAERCSHTGHKYVVGPFLSCHQGLHNPERFFQLSKCAYLGSCYCVVAGKGVSGVGEADCFVRSMSFDRFVNGVLGKAIDRVVSCENTFK